MGVVELSLLALGLAADAIAVSMSLGLRLRSLRRRDALTIAAVFGAAQALMPCLGYLAGVSVAAVIASWDHWLAFLVLAAVGGKTVWEGLHADGESSAEARLGARMLGALALATSVDALAVGLTLPGLGVGLVVAAPLIGAVTFATCWPAAYLGRRFGARLGAKVDIAGGLVLIGIGGRIAFTHVVG